MEADGDIRDFLSFIHCTKTLKNLLMTNHASSPQQSIVIPTISHHTLTPYFQAYSQPLPPLKGRGVRVLHGA